VTRTLRLLRLLLLVAFSAAGLQFGWVGSARALEVPPLRGRVNDLAGIIPAARARNLEQQLMTFESGTGYQFAVLTVTSLEGDPIEDFGIRVVEQWKLGRADKDDGLLLLVAVEDRLTRIEVGYGLEGVIPDALAGRIVDSVITPRFRAGDYAAGIEQGLAQLMSVARGEATPLPQQPASENERAPAGRALAWLLLLAFLGISSLFSRRRGRRHHWLAPTVGWGLGGGMRGGFGGGGFRGGGGGFGGGGATGRW
jgi:uncharacterized protein